MSVGPPHTHTQKKIMQALPIDPALRVLREIGFEVHDPKSLSHLHRAVLLGTPTVELKKYKDFLDSRDDQGRTPLKYAIEIGSLEVCKELIELGANVDTPDSQFVYPLHQACVRGDGEVVDLILRKTKLHNAVDTARGETCLISACRTSNWEIVPRLGKVVDLSLADARGRTALHWLIQNMGSVDTCIEALEFLLVNRVNVNAQDFQGRAPLHIAASRGIVDVLQLLCKNGAHLNITDSIAGETPLHLAVSKPSLLQGKTPVFTALLELKADVSIKRTVDSATALDLVAHMLTSRTWSDNQKLAMEVAARRLGKTAEDLQRV